LKKLKIRIDNHMTLRERIVETIRNAIVNGQLAPGTRIAEPELAEKFGISRTPIREAFRQLESEGFITVVPRKGAIVASLSPHDIADFYDLKMVLEGYAARCAVKTLTESDLTKMEAVNRQIEAASEKKDLRRLLDLHNEFHEQSWAKGGGIMHMMQIWVNLPRKHKLAAPKYQALTNGAIPEVALPGGKGLVRVISGIYEATPGAASTFTAAHMLDLRLKAGAEVRLPTPRDFNTALLVLAGRVKANGSPEASARTFPVSACIVSRTRSELSSSQSRSLPSQR